MVIILEEIIYLLNLTVNTEALWTVVSLALATLLMAVYFGIYREEKPGWNTYLSNSFVLIFVAIALLRQILLIDAGGTYNIINYWGKTLLTVGLFSIGLILMKFNFAHIIPEKLAMYLNSPITVNFVAYVIILLIYSERQFSWAILLASIIIILILIVLLILIKWPMGQFRKYLEREKKQDRIRNVKEAKFQIEELQSELKGRIKEFKILEKREINEKGKEASKLKKFLNNVGSLEFKTLRKI